jgi:hypothetical protein
MPPYRQSHTPEAANNYPLTASSDLNWATEFYCLISQADFAYCFEDKKYLVLKIHWIICAKIQKR